MKIQSVHRLLNYFLRSLKNDIKHFIRFIGYFNKYKNVKFHYSTVIYSSSILKGNNALGQRSRFEGYMVYGLYIQEDCNLSGIRGGFTFIAPNVKCNRSVHPTTYSCVSTSPSSIPRRGNPIILLLKNNFLSKISPPINIGNDCWMGKNVFIVGGVPTEIIKYRYNEEVIEFFLRKNGGVN